MSIMVYQMEQLHMECFPISGEVTMNSLDQEKVVDGGNDSMNIPIPYKRMRLYIGRGELTAILLVMLSSLVITCCCGSSPETSSPLSISLSSISGRGVETLQGPPTNDLLLTSANIY